MHKIKIIYHEIFLWDNNSVVIEKCKVQIMRLIEIDFFND